MDNAQSLAHDEFTLWIDGRLIVCIRNTLLEYDLPNKVFQNAINSNAFEPTTLLLFIYQTMSLVHLLTLLVTLVSSWIETFLLVNTSLLFSNHASLFHSNIDYSKV
jgi:hypothetical protein